MPGMDEHPVLGVLDLMKETVASKANDYADDDNVFSNFEGSGYLTNTDAETVFQTLIGIKVERLRQLTSGKIANHESIDDTLLDLANYAALWLGYRMFMQRETKDVITRITESVSGIVFDPEQYEKEILGGGIRPGTADHNYEGGAGDPV